MLSSEVCFRAYGMPFPCAQVAVKVEEGVKELVRAEKKQKGNRMIMCIMLLCCAVVFLLLLVIFKAIFF